MKTPPGISEIKQWLLKNIPLGLFTKPDFAIEDIDPKPWSGHFNYLITAGNQKFVLRFKGPEWGEPTKGIINEYNILKAVGDYKAGPKVYYLTKDFFSEPMLFEEYLEGTPLNKLSEEEQMKIFPEVAKLIAKINRIKLPQEILRKQEDLSSYEKHKQTWQERLKIILGNENARLRGERIKPLLPRAEKMLDGFESRLKRVLERSGPVFAFKSAHIGHCLKTQDGLRFLNWEENGFGDPSYSLAVFLASLIKEQNFSQIKEKMLRAYLEENPVPEFEELVDQRLKEREVSNLLWVVWAGVKKGETQSINQSAGIQERFERVKKLLK